MSHSGGEAGSRGAVLEAELPGKLVGLSYHTIDPDGRFILPQRTRRALGGGFVLTRGIENCLWLLPYHVFDAMQEQWLKGQTLWDRSSRMLGYRFIGQAVPLDPDRSYRVVIPKELRDAVDLGTDVVALGLGDRVELWSAKEWRKFDESLTSDVIQAAAETTFVTRAEAKPPEPAAAA